MNPKHLSFSLFIMSLIFSFCSCDKDPDPVYSNTIVGKWKWVSTYKVIPPSATNPETPQNTGIQELLVFDANKTWYKTQNTALVDSGTYSLGHGNLHKYINKCVCL